MAIDDSCCKKEMSSRTESSSISVTPILISNYTDLSGIQFGGTSLLILIGVGLDFSRQLDSQLVMRHYQGFLK